MLTRSQTKAAKKKPIGRMKERLTGRIVDPCSLACFTCDRFLGHNRHACPGTKDRHKSRPPAAGKNLPLCHVDFRTKKMEYPLDADNRLIPGQEKFYKTATVEAA